MPPNGLSAEAVAVARPSYDATKRLDCRVDFRASRRAIFGVNWYSSAKMKAPSVSWGPYFVAKFVVGSRGLEPLTPCV